MCKDTKKTLKPKTKSQKMMSKAEKQRAHVSEEILKLKEFSTNETDRL